MSARPAFPQTVLVGSLPQVMAPRFAHNDEQGVGASMSTSVLYDGERLTVVWQPACTDADTARILRVIGADKRTKWGPQDEELSDPLSAVREELWELIDAKCGDSHEV